MQRWKYHWVRSHSVASPGDDPHAAWVWGDRSRQRQPATLAVPMMDELRPLPVLVGVTEPMSSSSRGRHAVARERSVDKGGGYARTDES